MKTNIAFVVVNLLCAWYNFGYGGFGMASVIGGGFNCFVAGMCVALALEEWMMRRTFERCFAEQITQREPMSATRSVDWL